MDNNKELFEQFINEMLNTINDPLKCNRKYVSQVFLKNKSTLIEIYEDYSRLKKAEKYYNKIDKAFEIVKNKSYAVKQFIPEEQRFKIFGLCLSTDYIKKNKNNKSLNVPPNEDKLLTEDEAKLIGEVFNLKEYFNVKENKDANAKEIH